MPQSIATAETGLLLLANGVDAMLRWDGLAPTMANAGLAAPATALTVSESGIGQMVGSYLVYTRFVDADENYSNLSPVAVFTMQARTGPIKAVSSSTPIQITSPAHGLTTGTTVQIDGSTNTAANGTWTITVVDANTFSLTTQTATKKRSTEYHAKVFTGIVGGKRQYVTVNYKPAKKSAGGTWTAGAASLTYANVPLPTDPRVARRQILRNTDGQAQTLYVDIDTTDLSTTTFSSTLSDILLSSQPAVPLLDTNFQDIANLFGIPPNYKAVVAPHEGRLFAAVEVEYTEGCVAVTQGSASVQGIGTEWPSTFGNPSRYLFVNGATQPYQIQSVDRINQVLTLSQPYADRTDPYAGYGIRPPVAERRTIYYTEAGFPEAWPAQDAISIQEDGDVLTGLMPMGSFLYFLEKRHIYRFTAQSDPAVDGFVFLASNRGCVNNRCWVVVEQVAYCLDEQGVHGFSGGQDVQPLSVSIQDLFEPYPSPDDALRINWAAQQFFHAVHYPPQETIRWFVALGGSYLPGHALCYCYRTQRWWIEEFSFPVGASCLGRLGNHPQVFLGGPAGRVYAYGPGFLDGPDPSQGTVRGTATASTPTTLTDALALFPAAGVVGSPLVIVAGTGKGQTRRITAVAGTTLSINQPWTVQLDGTSVYQVGGINWIYRSGWFRWAEAEEEHPRRLEIVFEPTNGPATLDAHLYLDRAATPVLWDATYASADANQFSSTHNSPDLTADLTKPIGFVQKRLDSRREFYADGQRFLQLELEGVSNQDAVVIYGVTIDGASEP